MPSSIMNIDIIICKQKICIHTSLIVRNAILAVQHKAVDALAGLDMKASLNPNAAHADHEGSADIVEGVK